MQRREQQMPAIARGFAAPLAGTEERVDGLALR
jgi:hypothetical protein